MMRALEASLTKEAELKKRPQVVRGTARPLGDTGYAVMRYARVAYRLRRQLNSPMMISLSSERTVEDRSQIMEKFMGRW